MGLREFTEATGVLRNQPFSLADRFYLWDVYAATGRNLVLRASRQVEKSTYLANRIIYELYKTPGKQILFVSPRMDQSGLFSNDRLQPPILNSPTLRRLLWPHKRDMPVRDIVFHNGSKLYVRSAFRSADGCRGISADLLLFDEYQDAPPKCLDVLQETLSHAENAQVILTGTPKSVENSLEEVFRRSTAHEWHVKCAACTHDIVMDERAIGPTSLICWNCQQPISARDGRWIPRNPESAWGDGYTLNHLMVPWLDITDVLERQANYDRMQFLNEVLGQPTEIGDHVISRAEVEAACEDRPLLQNRDQLPAPARRSLIAGIDWGGGSISGTVLVVGYMHDPRVFRVVHFSRWRPHTDPNQIYTEVATICRRLGVRVIAADGRGNGSVYNRLLLSSLVGSGNQCQLWAIQYTEATQDPRREGNLFVWSVDRTTAIGALFTRIKQKLTTFPRATECGSFLDEFVVELFVHDDQMRRGRYTKPETERDDALHATVYAESVGLRLAPRLLGLA